MKKKRRAVVLLCLAVVVAAVAAWFIYHKNAVHLLGADEWMTDEEFAADYRAVNNDLPQRSSIFAWDMFFINDGAFDQLSEMLTDLSITRVYQKIPTDYFGDESLSVMVENLSGLGIETAFLTGDRDWLFDGPEELYAQLEALDAYNNGIGSEYPIKIIALDVESYTASKWKDDPESWFLAFLEMMKEVREYAHQKDLTVVQVIPEELDAIDQKIFERFIKECCDEVSVMNYERDAELFNIWNEVAICRKYQIPIESVFETMPLNDYYSVDSSKTYFYDGMDVLADAMETLGEVYGTSLGTAYHYYRTLYRVYSGSGLAEFYPYTVKEDPARDENGQPEALDGSLVLIGDDGSTLTASPYIPYLGDGHGETCYLAVGVRDGVKYTLSLKDSSYELVRGGEACFDFSEDKVLFTEAFRVQPSE